LWRRDENGKRFGKRGKDAKKLAESERRSERKTKIEREVGLV